MKISEALGTRKPFKRKEFLFWIVYSYKDNCFLHENNMDKEGIPDPVVFDLEDMEADDYITKEQCEQVRPEFIRVGYAEGSRAGEYFDIYLHERLFPPVMTVPSNFLDLDMKDKCGFQIKRP